MKCLKPNTGKVNLSVLWVPFFQRGPCLLLVPFLLVFLQIKKEGHGWKVE